MANPYGVKRPSGVPQDQWNTAEGFANEVYQDAEGQWIQVLEAEGQYGGLVRDMWLQEWLQLASDEARWMWAVEFRLETLIDRGKLADVIKEIGAYFLPDIVGAVIESRNRVDETTADLGNIIDSIAGLTDESGRAIAALSGAALSSLVDTGSTATRAVSSLADAILAAIGRNNEASSRGIEDLFRNSTAGIDGLLRNGTDVIGTLGGLAIGAIEEVLRESTGTQTGIIRVIGEILSDHIGQATDNNNNVTRAIERALESEVEQARLNSEAIERGLGRALDEVSGTSRDVISEIGRVLGTGEAGQATATREGAGQIATGLGDGFGTVGRLLARFTGEGETGTPEEVKDRINKSFSSVMAQGNCPQDFEQFLDDFVDAITRDWNITTPAINIMASYQYITGLITPALQVLGNCIAQTAARALPTSLNSPAELQEQMRQGLVSKAEAIQDLFSQGYTPERADRLLAMRRRYPEVGTIQTWFLRGMITPDAAFEYLGKLGFDLDDSQAILQMAYFIPPPADLITMAVREVFDRKTATRFGQFEDFPKEFADFARQQGISEEWAQRYWAAHWGLPSPQQGFEMFQRDVINEDDLKMLLKALDVMPFWRDNLIKIAYRPITRVDIRRMHDLGLLDHAAMVTRYRHMGYSPDDAEFMAQFTERLNAPKGEANVEELEGATRSTAIQLYEKGAIDDAQVTEILKEMGTGERAINVLLTNSRMKREMRERDEETDLILEQAKGGLLSITEAEDAMARIGLQPTELAMARAKLKRTEAQLTKLPSKTDLDKLKVAGLITEAEYALTLSKLGYSLFWTDRFLQLAKLTEKTA